MAIEAKNREVALELFKRQIDCLIRDDRKVQMELYAEDLRYEFPFATDRPKLIEGRRAFQEVMTPFWKKARRQGARCVDCKYEFHGTDEEGLFVSVFVLQVVVVDIALSLPVVQLLRIRNEHI